MNLRGYILVLLALWVVFDTSAQSDSIVVENGSTLHYRYTPIEQKVKRFDVAFVLTPTYTSSTGLGLGVSVAGSYSNDRRNPSLPLSTVNIFALATLKGVYNVGIEGNNTFRNDHHRLLYHLAFSSHPTRFWGLGYAEATTNNYLRYTSNRQHLWATYLYRLYGNIYIGTQLGFDYIYARKSHRESLLPYLGNRKSHDSATSLSLVLEYDSRNSTLTPERGLLLHLQGGIRPKGLGSVDDTSYLAQFNTRYFQSLWSGAVLALDLYGEYNSAQTPWQFYARVGDQSRMRGYYEGQFMDNNLASVQVELRQRIWKRFGAVIWGGAANCFGTSTPFAWSHTLPTYGVGLRLEIKRGLNLRVDYGLGAKVQGRLINGLTVQLGEAF